jgi:hypothetical protein
MRKIVLIVTTVVVLTLPGIAETRDFKARRWVYMGLVEGAIGYPGFYMNAFKFVNGFQLPYGLGIGTSLFEGTWDEKDFVMGFLPLYIYYVPYIKWTKGGLGLGEFYSYISLNLWSAFNKEETYTGETKYYSARTFRIGAGINWIVFGVEAGFYSYSSKILSNSSFYGQIAFNLGLWKGFGESQAPIKIKPEIKPRTVTPVSKPVKTKEYKARWWVYGSIGEGALAVPLSLHANVLKIVAGFSPPYGFGIGVSAIELVFENDGQIQSELPLYLYYVPHIKWRGSGWSEGAIYSFISFNPWGASYTEKSSFLESRTYSCKYFKAGVGIQWIILGAEAGFYSYSYENKSNSSFYLGINLTLGMFKGFDIREK